jgi:hypothetical protein
MVLAHASVHETAIRFLITAPIPCEERWLGTTSDPGGIFEESILKASAKAVSIYMPI